MLALVLVALYVVTAGLVRQLTALNVGPLCLIVLIYAGVGGGRATPAPQSGRLGPARLVAAALFSPLRRRVQQLVDRRFNWARYDAERTVRAFAARLMDAVDLDAVRDDLAGLVNQALEPTHVSVWSRQRD